MKILCMSQNLKDIRRKLDGASLQVASHIIKLCMYPNSTESNHWKQEVWAILFSVPKRSGTNKFPGKQFILDSTLGIWGDTLDNIVDAHKGYEENQSAMPDTAIIHVVILYFRWLADELSKNGKVRPQPVYDKLKELGISD